MLFEVTFLKDALRNVTIILWQSLSSVSMVLALQKDLSWLVTLISSKVPFKFLKEVWDRIYYVC